MKRLPEPPAEAAPLAPARPAWGAMALVTAVLLPFFTATVYVTARPHAS